MTTREAGCGCGRLRLRCEGDPLRISMCHCLDCQRRTGSPFGVQAWFPRERVAVLSGAAASYVRRADSGRAVAFSFCPSCGSTVSWRAEQRAAWIAIPVGAFADPAFPKPSVSVWERRKHAWTGSIDREVIDHSD